MKTGETIRNNQTGETLPMLVSEEDNGGARSTLRTTPSAEFHPDQRRFAAASSTCRLEDHIQSRSVHCKRDGS
jgi:hypothetical protein